jgi:hypothetical protein
VSVEYHDNKIEYSAEHEKITRSISKNDLVTPSNFESIEEINYYIEKLGFSDSMFNTGSGEIPANFATYLMSAKRVKGKSQIPKIKQIHHPQPELKQERFKTSELIHRGSDLSDLQRKAIHRGSRVVFVGKTTSIPFGMVGTVNCMVKNTPSVEVIADDEFEFGIKSGKQKKLFKTRIGDLLNIDVFNE